ncbi:MAG: SMP-30/gluconolactonase/LRE family protein [Chloroflexi bacterium]|nr:SMP-30/gluconolactonase/LRE family protein [Chloroflexota bacterium]
MQETFEAHHDSFSDLLGEEPTITHLATGFGFTEGPIWRGDHLLFTDIPNSRIVRYQVAEEGPVVSTFRYPSGNANGMTLDGDGNLVTCEHSNRRVTRTDDMGNITVLANRYEGKRLNSPNDVVVKSDGALYFTDPPYGLPGHTQGKELDFNGVFRIGGDGELTLLIDDMDRPNGLAFSPDEQKFYVADSARKHIRSYDVGADGGLSGEAIFAELNSDETGVPDGMKVDTEGRVYSTGPGGLWIFGPDGSLLGRIRPPEVPANCAWGDDMSSLFLTARTGLYKIRFNATGVRPGG